MAWRADQAPEYTAVRMGVCASLALRNPGLGAPGKLHAIGMHDDLGHEAGVCHQLKCHLVASLYIVRLSEQPPSLHTARGVSPESGAVAAQQDLWSVDAGGSLEQRLEIPQHVVPEMDTQKSWAQ